MTQDNQEQRSIRNLFSDLKFGGIVYPLLINVSLVTIASLAAAQFRSINPFLLIALAGALTGILTVMYVDERGGTHAFIGGMLSVPFTAWIAFNWTWLPALYGGIFCALAGLLYYRVRKRRS